MHIRGKCQETKRITFFGLRIMLQTCTPLGVICVSYYQENSEHFFKTQVTCIKNSKPDSKIEGCVSHPKVAMIWGLADKM